MDLKLSKLGRQMSNLTGVRAIMKDIIETIRTAQDQEFINLSAGNPVILPAVEQLWRDCTAELLASPEYGEVVCRYGASQGYAPLIEAVVKDFNQRYGLNLSDRNVLITPGSQSLYFLAANAFGGQANTTEKDTQLRQILDFQSASAFGGYASTTEKDTQLRQILLPLSPDYTGYGGVSLCPEAVYACRPHLEIQEQTHRFKYRPNLANLPIGEQTGCVIFSRPCNPTGNVLTDEEVQKIASLAATYDVPVFVDSAYGPPFPALNFTPMTPLFGNNVVHCMSLSKAGLPGERIGIAIADEAILQTLECFQTNLCIHSSRYGQAIAARAIASGRLTDISEQVIRPFYAEKIQLVATTLDQHMPDVPWFLHQGEGAIFAWLWFRDLPLTDWELYQALKTVGVIAVPGNPFFPGLREDWDHAHQCIRVSLTATHAELDVGMQRLAQVVEKIYLSGGD